MIHGSFSCVNKLQKHASLKNISTNTPSKNNFDTRKNRYSFQSSRRFKNYIVAFSMMRLCGYASVFDVVDAQGECIKRGAFSESLLYYQKCGTAPPMFYEHDPNHSIGYWLKMHEDKHGLWVEGVLDQEHSDYHAFFQKLMMRDTFSLSIGFDILESYFEKGCHTIEKIHLFEISLVSHPANPLTKISRFQDI